MNWFGIKGMGKRGYSRQKRGCPGVSRARAEPRAGLLFPMLPSFSWLPPGSGAAAEGRRLGGATEAVHLGRTSEDSLRHQLPIGSLNLLHNHGLGAAEGARTPSRAEAGLEGAEAVAEARAGEAPVGCAQSSWSGTEVAREPRPHQAPPGAHTLDCLAMEILAQVCLTSHSILPHSGLPGNQEEGGRKLPY